MGRPSMTGASMIVPFSVVFAIGVAEGPKTIPDEVTFPALGAAVSEALPDVSLTIEDARELLCEADVANVLPDVGPFEDSEMAGELELGEGWFVEVAGPTLELPGCRLSTALCSAQTKGLLSVRTVK